MTRRREDAQSVTIKITGRYTRQHNLEVPEEILRRPDSPICRLSPYVEGGPARATVEAMQAVGPTIPKVDPKTLYDNSLLKGLEAEGFLEKIKPR